MRPARSTGPARPTGNGTTAAKMNRLRRPEPGEGARPAPGAPAAAHRRGQSDWLLLGGAFTAFTVSTGLMQSYAIFLVAFIQDFGWSRAETSVPYSVSQLVAGGSSPLVGALVDRLGPLRLLLLGGGLLILGLLACAEVSALWQIIACYGVIMTIGANCLGLVVFVPLLSRRFVRRRGMAISVVQSANGFARAWSAPIVQLLISSFGWRATFLIQAGFMAAMIVPLAALFRRTAAAPTPVPPSRVAETQPAPASRRRRRRRHPAGPWPRRCARRISGCCSRSICSPGSAAFWCRCTSSPLPSIAASTSSMPPGCWAWAAFWRSPARSSPARCPTISGANGRRSWPMASRSSASSAPCSSPGRTRAGCCGCSPACSG